ncbi:hypothetical protein AVEN_249602-1 [Araneus ventricosus]|uniref:Uncharacterized protein n=1 Tax=Araneus ventricosus TaxID=182803 RepID=A0A4Y2TZH7_ARAVE|nr:hypothetical protein AVEN_263798-1 [Araneus ventricosus]GBO05124.1 hypothetical protein AVEN_249602-1 [Araneus ventricosus]
MRKDDIFFPWTGNQIFLSIHSPFVPVNPLLEGNHLKSGYEYNIYVRLDEEHLQPHPYETNCTDYDALWRKNNKTGPRSQEMCKALCYLSYSRACYDCEKPKVMLYRPENLCSDQIEWSGCKDENATERRNACRRNCNPACFNLALQIGKNGSLKQVNSNELVTTRQACHKLATSNSLQTIGKTEYEDNFGLEPPTTRFIAKYSASALATQPAELR